jgi:hypothetical protein
LVLERSNGAVAKKTTSSKLSSAAQQLYKYKDIYGEQEQDPFQSNPLNFSSSRNTPFLSKNTGIPQQQYLEVTHWNQRYNSYAYSLQAATTGTASAPAQYVEFGTGNGTLGHGQCLPTRSLHCRMGKPNYYYFY